MCVCIYVHNTYVRLFYSCIICKFDPQFGLSSVDVGFVFIITGGTYAFIAPVIGYVCDTGLNPKKIMILGSILTVVSYAIVGPAPFVPLSKYAHYQLLQKYNIYAKLKKNTVNLTNVYV